jgi:multidrug efflux pump subunit AcrA (membrane-fusion protein)
MRLTAQPRLLFIALPIALLLTACNAPGPGPGQGLPGAATPSATSVPLPTRAIAPRKAIAAEGALALATPPLQLSFDVSSRITAVNVAPGQEVKVGDVLAQVDDGQLKDALQQAREQLALAEAQSAQQLAPAHPSDIASARAALNSAMARYDELKQGPSPLEIDEALRSLNQAKNDLYSAQLGRDVECGWSASMPEVDKVNRDDPDCKYNQYVVANQERNVASANLRYQDAQQPPSKDKLLQAYADVVSARSNLAKLQAGASEEQRRVADLQLAQSRVAVARAERSLEKAQLVSPCDCTVQEVALTLGGISSPGATAVTLLRLDNIRFRTSNLTERDVTDVRIDATVSLRLRAFELPFTGKVRAILPQSSGAEGANALFTVVIELDPTDEALLPGMTGEAEIRIEN